MIAGCLDTADDSAAVLTFFNENRLFNNLPVIDGALPPYPENGHGSLTHCSTPQGKELMMKLNCIPALGLLLTGAMALQLAGQAQAQPPGNPGLDDEMNLALPFLEPSLPPGSYMDDRPPGPPMAGAMPPPPMLHGLRLTEAQSDKAFAIVYAMAPQIREQAKAIRKMEESLHDSVFTDDYDETRLKPVIDAGAKAIATMIAMRIHADRQIYELLTPEQRKQVATRNDDPGHDRRIHPSRQELPAR
jgi:Spy/CpxP family protein refolding chaperone